MAGQDPVSIEHIPVGIRIWRSLDDQVHGRKFDKLLELNVGHMPQRVLEKVS